MKDIVSVMDHHTDFKVDRRFVKQMLNLVNDFIRKDSDSINFFGGNLLGVYSVKWVNDDMELLFDILGIDDLDTMRTEILDLPEIESYMNVASNPINLSLLYVVHRAINAKSIPSKDRDHLATAAIDLLQYKFLSSIHTRYFKHKANEGIALATYESLDRKSGLKKYGTWKGLIDSRTNNILESKGNVIKLLTPMTDTYAVVLIVNEIQTGIRSLMNSLTDKFYDILEADTRIASSDKFVTVEGEQIIKDSINRYESMRTRMHSVIVDRNSFISEDLLNVVVTTVNTATVHNVEDTLIYISENYNSRKLSKELNSLIEDIIILLFDIIRRERMDLSNIPMIALKVRNLFRSSRVVDTDLITVRERMGIIIENSLSTHSTSVISSTRIATIVYIVLRAMLDK